MGQKSFDEKRMDMMMEHYKAEILKMQRAGLPLEEDFKQADIPLVEKVTPKENIFSDIKKERENERLIFPCGITAGGFFHSFENLPKEFEFLEKEKLFCRFSSPLPKLPDLQRGEKLLELKAGEACIPFISLPAYFCDDMGGFSYLLDLRLNGLYDKGYLWKCLIKNKDILDAVLYNFSDMGTPSYYDSAFYRSPAYIFKNEEETGGYRFILEPERKENPFSDFENSETGASDRDFMKRSLRESLEGAKRVVFHLFYEEVPGAKSCYFKPSVRWHVEKKPLGDVILECETEDISFSMDKVPKGFYLWEEAFGDAVRLFNECEGKSTDESAFMKLQGCECQVSGFKNASERLGSMNEREARRLRENIASSMENLDGEVLEKALLIISEADMDFGRALMKMIEA